MVIGNMPRLSSSASRLQRKNNTAARITEAEMRKEDRIRQQHDREQQSNPKSSTQPKEQEKVRGSAEGDRPSRPPRQSGRLPLPD
jgi:hypothetical protein